MSAVVVIGAGPAGTCLVERICANTPQLGGGRVLDLHVVDPYPPGAGRSWRAGQPDALRAASGAGDLTLFTDGATGHDGPARPGPSLAQWLGREPGYSASRSAAGGYLAYAFGRAVRGAPGDVRVRVHRARAVALGESAGTQRVELSSGRSLEADAVVLAQGRPDVPPSPSETRELLFAARHGLTYLPGGQAADLDLESVPAGEPVLVRGLGREFADVVASLTVGRGGRFAERRPGELVYLPSGDEPLLHAGSRRGVPYHARPGYRLGGTPPELPRFLTAATPEGELREAVARELAYAYYHELFTRHPARTRIGWDAFETAFARAEWGGRELRALVTKSVPGFADRLHLDRRERPLHGMRFGDLAGLQRWMHGYLAADLERRADPARSADLAMIHALHSAHAVLTAGKADDPWFQGVFGLLAGGPSLARQAELHALGRAGILTFLGADLRVEQDERAGTWRATSSAVSGSTTARALVDARRPAPDVLRSTDPLIAGLFARGECQEKSGLLDVRLPDRRLITRTGAVHASRFALGSWTAGGAPGFDRPGGTGPLLRQADALARTVVAQAAGSRLRAAA